MSGGMDNLEQERPPLLPMSFMVYTDTVGQSVQSSTVMIYWCNSRTTMGRVCCTRGSERFQCLVARTWDRKKPLSAFQARLDVSRTLPRLWPLTCTWICAILTQTVVRGTDWRAMELAPGEKCGVINLTQLHRSSPIFLRCAFLRAEARTIDRLSSRPGQYMSYALAESVNLYVRLLFYYMHYKWCMMYKMWNWTDLILSIPQNDNLPPN